MPELFLLLLASCAPSPPAPPPAVVPPEERVPEAAAQAEPTEAQYAASHVVIAWAGATRAPSGVTRTEDEAHQRAIDLWRRLEAGEELESLARRYSDGASAVRGGSVGVFVPGSMMPAFEAAVAAVEIGATTRPFRTAFGWHVARRDAVRQAEARHILVSWKGAMRSTRTRTRDQARVRIEEARQRLIGGEEFAVVARSMGEDATAPFGGELGMVAPGQLVPAFEDALFALSPGARSEVIETPYGFHLIERVR